MDGEASRIGLDRGDGFFTVCRFKHLVATLFQREADCFSDTLFVINNEHSPCHHARPLSANHPLCIMYSSVSVRAIPSNRLPPRLSLFTPIPRPGKLPL